MLGSFVSKNGTHFRISHPLLFSVVSSHYGKSFGEAIINNVSIDFLINEVDLKASVSVHLELEIHSCLFLSLAKRFHEEIRQGRPTILKARIFLSSEFVEIFLKYLKAKTFEDIKKYYILDRSRKTQIDNMSGMSCLNSKSDSSNVISFLVYYGHVNILRFLTELVVSHNQSTDLMFGGFDDQVKHLVLASYNGDRILIDFVLKFMQEGVIHMYNELLSRLNLEELHLIAGCLFRSQTISLSKEFDNVEFQFKNKDDNKTDTTESAQMTFVAKLNNYCTYLNRCHTFGNLPLISASEYGFLTAVDLLIHVGADINKFDKYGDPPLLAASRSGYLTVVEKLINHGADINQCIEFGDSPLIAASQSGHLTVVEKLINHGASINQCNVYGDSPLTSASQSGHLTVVEKLINHGADINQCNECNRSPLIAASQSGNLTVVEKLISHGANINQCHMFGDSPLASASQSGHLTVVEKLINHGADINQCNEYNRSPLIAASQSGHLTVVEKLISHGACINQCAKFGEFPLFVASQSGHLNVVEKLINCGADINQCNKYGRSPLYVASQSGHLTVVKKLTNHGANINQCDNCGNYPLSATFRSSQQPVVEEFIEHGKTLNERSSNVHYESIMKSEINELVNKEKDRFNEYMNEKPQSGKQLKTSSQELYKTRSEVVKIPYDSEIYSRSTNDFAFERSERNRKYLRCEIQ
ncbi:ankyrin repeat domain-containing protein 50-like [Saccostrea cucullata]|uniref:ankyrin repeat domain-containing protein 50-like n=2 Tax=Saccostrea cuccullata TaxID=36930 RepID=UPI002ED356AC